MEILMGIAMGIALTIGTILIARRIMNERDYKRYLAAEEEREKKEAI